MKQTCFYIKAVLTSLYLLILPALLFANSPKDVSGLVNETRAKVTAVGVDFVVVDDVTGFSVTGGDTILIIQMKGDAIRVTNDVNFGKHQDNVGDVGYYEFIVTQLVEPGLKKITFFNDLKGTYNAESFVQIIKVESYNTLRVDGVITTQPWDSVSGTGGVIAIFAHDKVILDNNINVSGLGFRGGESDTIDGICPEVLNSTYFFSESSTRAGHKGEGHSSHNSALSLLDISLYSKGVGPLGAGGGSGDGGFSGGGGGGSYGFGGVGGEEVGCSFVPNQGGSGGRPLNAVYPNSVVMGGGGGSSGYQLGSTAPNGGAGGGIVFIMTDSIYGNTNSILANGESVTVESDAAAGGAGGGAAGTIIISANGYGSILVLEANGGDGGDTPNGTGNGGGGSGGLIWVSPAIYDPVTFDNSGGLSGNYVGISSSDGDQGPAERTDLSMRLNGFLFNTVVTERDGNLLDSICYGEVPRALKASVPVGGTLPFTIYWEKSNNGVDSWVAISGTDAGNVFTPDQTETDTLWIRRRIVDNTLPTNIVDISKSVKVIVHPLITSFQIGHDTGDTICLNQDPSVIEPLVPTPGGGNGVYIYKWHDSPDGAAYNQTLLSGMSTYDPAALSNTTWYRRTVYSGACLDSTSSVKITVLPLLANNTVGSDQEICEPFLFAILDDAGAPVSGGDGVYRWEWEASKDNVIWNSTVEGDASQQSYDPDEGSVDFINDTTKYYRRIVYSGESNCCVDISPSVKLTMRPQITFNELSILSQDVCEGVPNVSDVTGTTPLGGTGTYNYQWEYFVTPPGSWFILTDSTRKNLSPKILFETTSFRRKVVSGVCEDISIQEFVVTVQPMIMGNVVTILSEIVDTICAGQDPALITGPEPTGGLGAGSFTYLWQDSTEGQAWLPAPSANTSSGYDPAILTNTTYFRRIAYSGECESVSNSVRIEVLPIIEGNTIGDDGMVCYETDAEELTGKALLTGGDGIFRYKWESASDAGFSAPVPVATTATYQPLALTTPKFYRRIVLSGKLDRCKDTSNTIIIGINPLPIGLITSGQDESICEDEDISLSLTITTGAFPFNVVLNDDISTLPLLVSSTGTIAHDFIPNYSSDQNLTYTLVSITDANGCLATNMTGSKSVELYEMPVSFAGLADEWCLANGNALDATASVGVGTWSWAGAASVFDQINNAKSAVDFTNFVAGDTLCTFLWKETNGLSRCVDSSSVNIRFYKPPTIAYAGNDSSLLPFQVDMVLFANDPVFGIGEWTILTGGGSMKTGDSDKYNGMVQGLSDGLNMLEWRITNGNVCLDSFDEVELHVPEVRLISGFSPNNDGINDYFVINGLVEWDGDIVPNELVITDMSGVILYQEKDYANDWDGRDMRGKPLPSGTYYYFINVFYSTKVQLKGFVIIKRD